MQELVTLRDHVLMIVKTGTAQADAAASALNWERLQGAVATMTDKAMYLLVIARTPLCERGGHSAITYRLVGYHHTCAVKPRPVTKLVLAIDMQASCVVLLTERMKT